MSSDHIVDVFVGKAIIGQINETLIPAIALDIRKSAQRNDKNREVYKISEKDRMFDTSGSK